MAVNVAVQLDRVRNVCGVLDAVGDICVMSWWHNVVMWCFWGGGICIYLPP